MTSSSYQNPRCNESCASGLSTAGMRKQHIENACKKPSFPEDPKRHMNPDLP